MIIHISNSEAFIIMLLASAITAVLGFLVGYIIHWIFKKWARSWTWGLRGAIIGLILPVATLGIYLQFGG